MVHMGGGFVAGLLYCAGLVVPGVLVIWQVRVYVVNCNILKNHPF